MIDAHTHFFPAELAQTRAQWASARGEIFWARLVGERPDGKRGLQGFPSEKKFLSDMDAAGVERAVVLGWYWENPDTCDELNSLAAAFAKRHPDRISAFASVQPRFGRRAALVAESARERGFCGVGEIHDGVQGFSYSGGDFEIFARACAKEKLPINVHLTERGAREYFGKIRTDNRAAFDAAKKFSDTNFIFAHWAGLEIFDSPEGARAVFEKGNAFFDSAANSFLRGESAWAQAAPMFPEAALYGSDYPLRLYPRKFKAEEMKTFADEARANVPPQFAEKFFRSNAAGLLGLCGGAARAEKK